MGTTFYPFLPSFSPPFFLFARCVLRSQTLNDHRKSCQQTCRTPSPSPSLPPFFPFFSPFGRLSPPRPILEEQKKWEGLDRQMPGVTLPSFFFFPFFHLTLFLPSSSPISLWRTPQDVGTTCDAGFPRPRSFFSFFSYFFFFSSLFFYVDEGTLPLTCNISIFLIM